MSRLPIRVRLTLAFALAMAVVLVAIGAFLYARLGASLDEAIDEGIQTRSAEVLPDVARGTAPKPGVDPDEQFVQVLDARGDVVAGTLATDLPLIDPEALASMTGSTRTFVLDDVEDIDGRVRVLATRVETSTGTVVMLVGSSLEDRDDAVSQLLALLLVGGSVALVLTSLLGYGLATLALRPVESMRVEAAAISASELGRRLPVPETHDEISRLGETLNQMLDRLEIALSRERSFVADASHELRTPVALLKAELDLALRRPRSEAELDDALRSAAVEADRLAQLTDDLLVLARSDDGHLELARSPVSVELLLENVAGRFANRARETGRTIEVDVPEPLDIDGDRLRLEQALANLVENAVQHGDGAIRLSAHARDGFVELHVLDDGDGFPAAFLPHAFERFSRADTARSGEGAGLGLTIAAVVASAHGGGAHVQNRPGRGADAWLVLPRRP